MRIDILKKSLKIPKV